MKGHFPHLRSTSLILSLRKNYLSRLPKKKKKNQGTQKTLPPSPTQADSGRKMYHLTFRHFLSIHDKVVLGQAGEFIEDSFLLKCCRWKIGNRQWQGENQRYWFAASGPETTSYNFPGNVWHCTHSKRKYKLLTDFTYWNPAILLSVRSYYSRITGKHSILLTRVIECFSSKYSCTTEQILHFKTQIQWPPTWTGVLHTLLLDWLQSHLWI